MLVNVLAKPFPPLVLLCQVLWSVEKGLATLATAFRHEGMPGCSLVDMVNVISTQLYNYIKHLMKFIIVHAYAVSSTWFVTPFLHR